MTSVFRQRAFARSRRLAHIPAVGALVPLLLVVSACRPSTSNESPATVPLPTRQTTIAPVVQKIEAAKEDEERRRADSERAGQ